jgi:hypothetical protein
VVIEVWRKHEINAATYYKWKAKYGGLDASESMPIEALKTQNCLLLNCLLKGKFTEIRLMVDYSVNMHMLHMRLMRDVERKEFVK